MTASNEKAIQTTQGIYAMRQQNLLAQNRVMILNLLEDIPIKTC